MGFLNKAFRKVKKQIQPGNMIARDMGPGNMPRRPSLDFLEGRMPRRGGGFGNLGEAIRRMQEQGGMPRPIARRDPSALERLPMGEAPSFNPTIFGQPIPQGADFSNMPDFSQIDMSQLDLSGIPQSISQMNLPQMPEGLPSMEEIQGNRRMPQMRMGEMQPRVMMAVGGSAITALSAIAKKIKNMPGSKDIRNKYFDPNVIAKNNLGRGQPSSLVASARGATINDRLRRGTELAIPAGALAAADATQGFSEEAQMQNMMLSSPEQFGKDMARMKIGLDQVIELASKKAREIGAIPGEYVGRAKQSYEQEMEAERMQQIDSQEGLQNVSLLFNQGGEAMKGYANGGEIEAMLSGMGAGEQEAMGELEQMAPEMEMIDQLVMMVAQMIQQGAGEEQVISFLREQGLDDEDIGTVLQLVAEMAETEEVAAQNEIGADLEQLG
jgi:hypothetical protein